MAPSRLRSVRRQPRKSQQYAAERRRPAGTVPIAALIDALAGNDVVDLAAFAKPANVIGGLGDDLIVGGSKDDGLLAPTAATCSWAARAPTSCLATIRRRFNPCRPTTC